VLRQLEVFDDITALIDSQPLVSCYCIILVCYHDILCCCCQTAAACGLLLCSCACQLPFATAAALWNNDTCCCCCCRRRHHRCCCCCCLQDEPDSCSVQLVLQEVGRYKLGGGTYTQVGLGSGFKVEGLGSTKHKPFVLCTNGLLHAKHSLVRNRPLQAGRRHLHTGRLADIK
jgi:hypothetical protein